MVSKRYKFHKFFLIESIIFKICSAPSVSFYIISRVSWSGTRQTLSLSCVLDLAHNKHLIFVFKIWGYLSFVMCLLFAVCIRVLHTAKYVFAVGFIFVVCFSDSTRQIASLPWAWFCAHGEHSGTWQIGCSRSAHLHANFEKSLQEIWH